MSRSLREARWVGKGWLTPTPNAPGLNSVYRPLPDPTISSFSRSGISAPVEMRPLPISTRYPAREATRLIRKDMLNMARA